MLIFLLETKGLLTTCNYFPLLTLALQDDSMTDEAIKKAEEELQSSPTKLKRVPITRYVKGTVVIVGEN